LNSGLSGCHSTTSTEASVARAHARACSCWASQGAGRTSGHPDDKCDHLSPGGDSGEGSVSPSWLKTLVANWHQSGDYFSVSARYPLSHESFGELS
jgi:hypothetical protein